MIEIPWQVVASLFAVVGLQMLLNHWRHRDVDERIQLARRQEHQDGQTRRAVELNALNRMYEEQINSLSAFYRGNPNLVDKPTADG